MALKEVLNTSNAAQFKFESVGQKLQGYLVASEEFELNGRMVRKHVFSTPKGLVGVLGNFMLNQGVDNIISQFGLGIFTVVTFLEVQKLKMGKTMKVFKIQYDEDNRMDVGTTNIADEPPADEDVIGNADADTAPSEAELNEPEAEEEVQTTAALPPAKRTNQPATVNKEATNRVQSVLSNRGTRR